MSNPPQSPHRPLSSSLMQNKLIKLMAACYQSFEYSPTAAAETATTSWARTSGCNELGGLRARVWTRVHKSSESSRRTHKFCSDTDRRTPELPDPEGEQRGARSRRFDSHVFGWDAERRGLIQDLSVCFHFGNLWLEAERVMMGRDDGHTTLPQLRLHSLQSVSFPPMRSL